MNFKIRNKYFTNKNSQRHVDLRTGLEYIFFSVTYFHTLVANKLRIILNTRQSELT